MVALDQDQQINNGEPQLHAAWLAAADPLPGDAVCHIGVGTGYYSALLSFMTAPGGTLTGYELNHPLATAARGFLASFEGVTIVDRDATTDGIPASDIIYINAGVVAPPAQWVDALKISGRMIFPWHPSDPVALAVLATRQAGGVALRPCGAAYFMPCGGASSREGCLKAPTLKEANAIRSLWRTTTRAPDTSALAIYPDVWFSSDPIT